MYLLNIIITTYRIADVIYEIDREFSTATGPDS